MAQVGVLPPPPGAGGWAATALTPPDPIEAENIPMLKVQTVQVVLISFYHKDGFELFDLIFKEKDRQPGISPNAFPRSAGTAMWRAGTVAPTPSPLFAGGAQARVGPSPLPPPCPGALPRVQQPPPRRSPAPGADGVPVDRRAGHQRGPRRGGRGASVLSRPPCTPPPLPAAL